MGFFSNLFNRKKKDEQNYTPAQNQSYARQSNPYQSRNSKLFSSAATNPLDAFGRASSRGQGLSYLQNKMSPSTPRRTNQSSAPKYQKTIAGSGYGSNYAINTGQSPAERQRRTKQVIDATKRNRQTRDNQITNNMVDNGQLPGWQRENQPNPAAQTMADLFKMQQTFNQQSANRQKQTAKNQNAAYVDSLRNSYDRQNQALLSQIPYLQQQSDASKQELLDAADTIRQSGIIQKDATEEAYGDALRMGAQTGREQERKLKNLFASLGTLDSSQFKNEMINTTEETTRGQQQTLRAKAREISSIEATVQEAQRKAQLAVQQEVGRFNETIRQIHESTQMNEGAKEDAIRMAYAELDSTLTGIEDTLAANDMALQQAKFEFQQQQQQLAEQKPGYGLSERFMNTGEPQTPEEEYILRQGETAAMNVINGFMDISSITDPNVKAIAQDIIAQSGATAGGTGSGNVTKVSAKDANIARTGVEDIATMRQMLSQNKNLPRTTKIPFAGQQYDTLRENLTDKIGRLRSGGAINADEEARFRKLLPGFYDTPSTVDFKLAQLEEEFNGLLGGGQAQMSYSL